MTEPLVDVQGASAPSDSSADRIVRQAYTDNRPRWRRMVAPVATAGATCAALGYLSQVNPNEAGHYPLCPTRWMLHLDCPGCGLMRGMYSALHGDVAGAVDHNILLVAAVPFAVVMWVLWVRRAWKGVTPALTARQATLRTRWTIAVLLFVIVFGVVRNFVPYLGSGIG